MKQNISLFIFLISSIFHLLIDHSTNSSFESSRQILGLQKVLSKYSEMGGATSKKGRRGSVTLRKVDVAQNKKFKQKRYEKWFDRAVHKAYSEPPQLFIPSSFFDSLYHRLYWSFRALQFKIFYKNEEMDLDEVVDKWEIGVQPLSLDLLAQRTQFSPKWIKYMYARFKNESPTGKMKQEEFRNLIASIIAPEKATDQYISRLFAAFAGKGKSTITFEDLLDNLATVHPQTAETNAKWTMRLITGGEGDCFGYTAFHDFTQSVFQLNEGKCANEENNKESVQQRATTIFTALDADRDGLVTFEDMCLFFQIYAQLNRLLVRLRRYALFWFTEKQQIRLHSNVVVTE